MGSRNTDIDLNFSKEKRVEAMDDDDEPSTIKSVAKEETLKLDSSGSKSSLGTRIVTRHESKRQPSTTSRLLKTTFFAGTPPLNAPAVDHDCPPDVAKPGCWAKTKNTFEVVGEVVRTYPVVTLAPPLLTLIILVACGITGVVLGSQAEIDHYKEEGLSLAVHTGLSFMLTIEKTFAPLAAMDAFIQQSPRWQALAPQFNTIAEGLLKPLPEGSIQHLQYSPWGIVREEFPSSGPVSDGGHVGIDIFNASTLRAGAIATIELGRFVLTGPLMLVGTNELGGIARWPVFIAGVDADETFGNDDALPTQLPLELVYNSDTRTKFWGFVTAIIAMERLISGPASVLNSLTNSGYLYVLTRPGSDADAPPFVFAESRPGLGLAIEDSVSHSFAVQNNVWTLTVAPEGGWQPGWKWPMVAAVIVISFVFSLMVFVMMVSLKQQSLLLHEVVLINGQLAETTYELKEEKARMDVMLVRQYNLIQCFSASSPRARSKGEDKTLSRIEHVRQQLNQDSVQSLAEAEQIDVLEVLGEGSFGKVYKGLWRGTEVAVKTMLLPANMTGAEKREKMAVMEAAISSSLMHPNIVATYTYSIKPLRDTTVAQAQAAGGIVLIKAGSTALMSASHVGKGRTPPPPPAATTPESGAAAPVHSFEVRLVLEFCDRGCLRDALDAAAFYGPQGLKYKAILDTALDVAKAMTHLHAMNVLHADLKARNVMLKCSGDARGFVAKVADFGLSVRMEHSETHMSDLFQGTVTHMAPEILLEGRVSKAADVYAFGVTLWELFTGGRAFKGTPGALLGHLVTREHKRPAFNAATPARFRELAEACWHPEHAARPTFPDVLAALQRMRADEEGPSEAVPWMPAPSKRGGSSSGGGRPSRPRSTASVFQPATSP
mmetsp:Transcript_4672/g.14117  ORF Transcript_4672/g.14117 Transcript_4672/m.14117 type:complete len:888 (-) Transcript_4672:1869-4532(-)